LAAAIAGGVLVGLGVPAKLLLGLVAALLVAEYCLPRPFVTYLTLLALVPIKFSILPIAVLQIGSPYQVLTPLALAACWLQADSAAYRRVLWCPATPPWLTLAGLAVASSFGASTGLFGAVQLVALVQGLLLYALTLMVVNTRPRFILACKVMAVAALVYSLWGIVDYAFGWLGLPTNSFHEGQASGVSLLRGQGPTGDPNYYAAYCLALLPFALGWASQAPDRLRRWLWPVASVLSFGAILVTFSRGMLAAAFLLFGLIWVLQRGSRPALPTALARIWNRVFLVLVITLAAGLITVAFVLPQALWRVGDALTGGSAGAGRTLIWRAIVQSIDDYPVGRGLGGIVSVPGMEKRGVAHNNLMEIVSALGVPGLLVYGWLLVVPVLVVAQRLRRGPLDAWLASAFGSWLALQFAGLSLSFNYSSIVMLIWGLLLAGLQLPAPADGPEEA
jgi:O-antigen ligase